MRRFLGETTREPAPLDDTAIAEINEFKRISSALEQKTKRVAELEAAMARRRVSNKSYVVEYRFPYETQANVGSILPQSQSFFVDKNTTFYCKSIGAYYSILGDGERLWIPPVQRWSLYFRYTWQTRDTAKDRAWSNMPLPDFMLLSQFLNPLSFGKGHAALGGGAEVVTDVAPYFSNNGGWVDFAPFDTITAHALQIVFSGIQISE